MILFSPDSSNNGTENVIEEVSGGKESFDEDFQLPGNWKNSLVPDKRKLVCRIFAWNNEQGIFLIFFLRSLSKCH